MLSPAAGAVLAVLQLMQDASHEEAFRAVIVMRSIAMVALTVIMLSMGSAAAIDPRVSIAQPHKEWPVIICKSGCYHEDARIHAGSIEMLSGNLASGYGPAYAGFLVIVAFLVVFLGSRSSGRVPAGAGIRESIQMIREEVFRQPPPRAKKRSRLTRKQKVIRNVANLEVV